jgi:hypothetical protein
MNEVPIDPVSVSTVLVAWLFGTKVSVYLGPYLIIACAGLTGAVFSLNKRRPHARLKTGSFLLTMTSSSLLLTVPAAYFISSNWPSVPMQWIISPVAVGIAYIGDNWTAIGKWVADVVKKVVESRTGEKT